jgi:hypothetical protein
VRWSLAAFLVPLSVLLALWVGGVASGATDGATITVSGALKGVISTPAADCSGLTSQSGEIDFYHPLKGFKTSSWSVFYTAPHSGTWRGLGGGSSSSFSLQPGQGITDSWVGKSGSFTTNETRGSANITLEPQVGSRVHGLVHVKGSWNCS